MKKSDKTSQKTDKFKQIKETFFACLSNTTSHAVPRIIKKENIILSLLWTVCFIGAVIGGSIMIYFVVDQYLKFDVITTISIKSETEIAFPSVTICLENNTRINDMIIECRQGQSLLNCTTSKLTVSTKKCIQLNSGTNNSELFKAIGTGDIYAYRMLIYNPFESDIRFAVTDNGDKVAYNDIIEQLYSGEETSIILSKTSQTVLGPPFSQCNPKLGYRKADCVENCYQKAVCEKCSCQSPEQTDDVISDSQTICSSSSNDTYYTILLKCRLECPAKCNNVAFPFNRIDVELELDTTTLDRYKSNTSAKFNTTGLSDQKFMNRLTFLKIYFHKLETTVITQSPYMSLSSFIANVGGLMGSISYFIIHLTILFILIYFLFQ